MEQEKLRKYLEQIRDFLDDGSREMKIELTIKKEGPDAFFVQYDTEAIGMLLMMIASDNDLMDLAMLALVKSFTDADPERMEETLRAFRRMCIDAVENIGKERYGNLPVLPVPKGGLPS